MNFGGIFDLKSQETQLKSLHKESLDPLFWNDKENASKILRNISRLENNIKLWADLEQRHSDISVLFEFAESGEIQDDEILSEIKAYAGIIRDLELKLMLGESQDMQTQELVVRKAKTGRICFSGCIPAGLNERASKRVLWITNLVMKRVSRI